MYQHSELSVNPSTQYCTKHSTNDCTTPVSMHKIICILVDVPYTVFFI